ncbi:MAG: DUF2780 domain-containing protein [Pseudomonadales bacterium]|jgi:hypothetical protein|nr:DUF2780 domain-containing protein [Pseudomonadales bacterium]
MRYTMAPVLLLAALLCAPAHAAVEGLLGGARNLAAASLPTLLGNRLGVSEEQAEGGMGAMLMLARSRLVAGDFDLLAGMIPGASGYLEAAKTLLGADADVSSVSGLESSLGAMGYATEAVSAFAPTVTDVVSSVGGERATSLLGQVFAAP